MTHTKLLICAALLWAACENTSSQWTAPEAGRLSSVEGLKDCRYYAVNTGVGTIHGGAGTIHVIRCPNSTTAVKHGKNQHIVVIDGGDNAETP